MWEMNAYHGATYLKQRQSLITVQCQVLQGQVTSTQTTRLKSLAAAVKMVGKSSLSVTKQITDCNYSILNQREQTSNTENVQGRLRIRDCDQRMSE